MSDGIRHAEQRRARWARETVQKLSGGKKDDELKSHIRKLPSHIQTSGLAQTLLVYGQKRKDLAERLAAHLELGGNTISESVEKLIQSPDRVRLKTREALAAAQWLKRFAEVDL